MSEFWNDVLKKKYFITSDKLAKNLNQNQPKLPIKAFDSMRHYIVVIYRLSLIDVFTEFNLKVVSICFMFIGN